jgi:hypothetical protein
MVHVVLVSLITLSSFPGFPSLLFRRRIRIRQKKRKAMINTKERLLSFFSAYTTHHAWSQKGPNMDRGIGREREYDRKRKKTLTNLARFGIQYSNKKLTV